MFGLAYFPSKKHQTFVNRRECSKTQQQQTQWNISLGCWNRKPKWFFLAASYTSKEILPLSCNTLCQELFSFCNLVSVHCNVHHTWKFHAFVGLKQSPHFFSKFAVLNCGFTWLTREYTLRHITFSFRCQQCLKSPINSFAPNMNQTVLLFLLITTNVLQRDLSDN